MRIGEHVNSWILLTYFLEKNTIFWKRRITGRWVGDAPNTTYPSHNAVDQDTTNKFLCWGSSCLSALLDIQDVLLFGFHQWVHQPITEKQFFKHFWARRVHLVSWSRPLLLLSLKWIYSFFLSDIPGKYQTFCSRKETHQRICDGGRIYSSFRK